MPVTRGVRPWKDVPCAPSSAAACFSVKPIAKSLVRLTLLRCREVSFSSHLAQSRGIIVQGTFRYFSKAQRLGQYFFATPTHGHSGSRHALIGHGLTFSLKLEGSKRESC